jgi:hypothetical protein
MGMTMKITLVGIWPGREDTCGTVAPDANLIQLATTLASLFGPFGSSFPLLASILSCFSDLSHLRPS